MSIVLNANEVRVLGALIEKRFTTPDTYPLTLNSLVAACNQTSNRFPVVEYDQFIINDALINTRTQGLSTLVSKSGARAHKFGERLCEALSLDAKESAVLAELMLRGPQTPGELRQRASRMVDIPELSSVERVLQGLATRGTPLVVQLPLQPGKREARYAQLLGGELDLNALEAQADSAPSAASAREKGLTERVATLEAQMAQVLEKLELLQSSPEAPGA